MPLRRLIENILSDRRSIQNPFLALSFSTNAMLKAVMQSESYQREDMAVDLRKLGDEADNVLLRQADPFNKMVQTHIVKKILRETRG